MSDPVYEHPDGGCFTCSENGASGDYPLGECPKSPKPCGHHDDCLWDMDVCHHCGAEINEDGDVVAAP